MNVILQGPVGVRQRRENTRNSIDDQKKVLDLLYRVPTDQGGYKGTAVATPLAGGNGECPQHLQDAIWGFQRFWKAKGLFHFIDGVVDPGGHTLLRLNLMAGGGTLPPEPGPVPILPPVIHNERIAGTWQVTDVSSFSIGEIGLIGGAKVKVAQPDGKTFIVNGYGAGFGVGLDPASWLKTLKEGAKALSAAEKLTMEALMSMLDKNVLFSIGDYLQLLGIDVRQLTSGQLIANPINKYLGRPTVMSRSLITGGGGGLQPFSIASVGGAVGAGGEAGLITFGLVPGAIINVGVLTNPVLGFYGTIGVLGKAGVGIQAMTYGTSSIDG